MLTLIYKAPFRELAILACNYLLETLIRPLYNKSPKFMNCGIISTVKNQTLSFRLTILGLSASVLASSAIDVLARPSTVLAQESARRPTIAKVKSMVNGDIMCYVTLVGNNGAVYKNVGADFAICAKEKTFLNRKVRLSYKKVRVNDCQSAEPCGKTRQETLITKMQVVPR